MRLMGAFRDDGTMQAIRRTNWWVIGGLGFCALAWGVAMITVAKTAHLYAHKSPAGFRHDLIEHARERWVEVKRVVAPAPPPIANKNAKT